MNMQNGKIIEPAGQDAGKPNAHHHSNANFAAFELLLIQLGTMCTLFELFLS